MSTATQRLPLIDLPVSRDKRGVGIVEVGSGEKKKLLPLENVEIKARVAERVASVTVKQLFANNQSEHLEAAYIFPLSGGCVVSDFEMKVGDRVIKGVVQERARAQEQYQQALQEGKRAALLEQERDDVFTVQVGNIPPGQQVCVSLTYSERLTFFENGSTELRLPLVVGQRYVPGADAERSQVGAGVHPDTQVVADASRITPPLLAQGFDPKVNLKITVDLVKTEGMAGMRELCCSQHAIQSAEDNGKLTIELARENERLNRDFVLRWRSGGEKVKSSLVVYHTEEGNYAMLSVLPPKRTGYLGAPRDVVFLLDRSGSMEGMKIVSAARACSILLDTLGPADRFAVCTFDNVQEWVKFGAPEAGRLVGADEENVDAAKQALRAISARGGTELFPALSECLHELAQQPDRDSRVPVVVVLTDGQVGDESRILKLLQTGIADSRVFTVGVDTAVNSGLLRRMANLGGGTASFVSPGSNLESALEAIGREIGQPLVTHLSVSAGKGSIVDGPANLPDLFAGRAVSVLLKLANRAMVRVQGKFADGSAFDEKVKATEVDMPAIAQLWAKMQITDLEDRFRVQPQADLKTQIIELAVKHSVLCKFTAFVAVDESEVVNKDGKLRQIVQPVEQAEGWEMYGQAQSAAGMFQSLTRANYGACDAVSSGAAPRAVSEQSFGRLSASYFSDAASGCGAPAPTGGLAGGQVGGQARLRSKQTPSSAPVPPNSGGAGGMYGTASRAQVLEVIVRQAIAGAAWREICAGPMQVHGITVEEVEQEMARRRGCLVGEGESATVQQQLALQIGRSFEAFKLVLDAAFAQISKGELPAADPINSARKRLLDSLSKSPLAASLPLLQKFLRGSAKELINSLLQAGAQASAIKDLWQQHMQQFLAVQTEMDHVLAGGEKPEEKFWESTV